LVLFTSPFPSSLCVHQVAKRKRSGSIPLFPLFSLTGEGKMVMRSSLSFLVVGVDAVEVDYFPPPLLFSFGQWETIGSSRIGVLFPPLSYNNGVAVICAAVTPCFFLFSFFLLMAPVTVQTSWFFLPLQIDSTGGSGSSPFLFIKLKGTTGLLTPLFLLSKSNRK